MRSVKIIHELEYILNGIKLRGKHTLAVCRKNYENSIFSRKKEDNPPWGVPPFPAPLLPPARPTPLLHPPLSSAYIRVEDAQALTVPPLGRRTLH